MAIDKSNYLGSNSTFTIGLPLSGQIKFKMDKNDLWKSKVLIFCLDFPNPTADVFVKLVLVNLKMKFGQIGVKRTHKQFEEEQKDIMWV